MWARKAFAQRTPRLTASLVTALGATALLVGCGSTPGTVITSGQGGAQNAGGSQVQSNGGEPGSGGLASNGGAQGQGGQQTFGGAQGQGGQQTFGGAQGQGGQQTFGGAPGEGGLSGDGGAVPIGGKPPTGGKTGAGGTTAPGGAPGTGGLPAAGGAPAEGGSTKPPVSGTGHYQMENLDRGVVAVVVTGGVYVGWRMFGYEYDTTATNVTYNLYRDGTKVANVTDSTNYLDAAGKATSSYTVTAVIKGVEGTQSPAITPWAQQYISIPLTPPTGGATYSASDGATGDLDGDGKLDIVLKWDPSDSHDNAQSGVTSDVYIDGYTLAGKRLWRIDLGPNIRAGAHYTQMSVYDFDGDGKAELAVKTAPGTKDGTGAYLSTGTAAGADNTAIYRNATGYILTGPEWITVFDGTTGKERATIDYPVSRGNVSSWGDAYGNRVDRFNGGFAFVKDGGTATGLPSIIQGRGYYTRLTVSALTYRNGVLAKNWVYDSVSSLQAQGAGDHSEMAADTDGDLGMEIITGQTTIDSAGTLKCQSGMGHGDALDVSELVPGKGITVFSIHEGEGGMDAHDGATCAFYFKTTEPGTDSNRGRAEYVGTGNEDSASCYCASCTEHQALCATGATTGPNPGTNFVIYWDADEWRETENANSISKAGGGTLLSCAQCSGNNSTKNTPTLTADLLGDWREEIVWRETAGANLRVYTTTDVTKRRIYTLMHDPTYRAQNNFQNSAYNQPPHTSFRIAPNMADPPVPDIFVK